ncbi:hypothetical protein GQR58_029711 [Nymphon striatum]|nr:hypothetical protein GQR58_029711 [Nymphon striatum]
MDGPPTPTPTPPYLLVTFYNEAHLKIEITVFPNASLLSEQLRVLSQRVEKALMSEGWVTEWIKYPSTCVADGYSFVEKIILSVFSHRYDALKSSEIKNMYPMCLVSNLNLAVDNKRVPFVHAEMGLNPRQKQIISLFDFIAAARLARFFKVIKLTSSFVMTDCTLLAVIQLAILKIADGKVDTDHYDDKEGSLRMTKFTLEDALPKSIKFTLGDVIPKKNNRHHNSHRPHNDLRIGNSRKSRKHSPPPPFHFRRPSHQSRPRPHRPGRPFTQRPPHRPRGGHRGGPRPSHRARGRHPRPPKTEYIPVFASSYGHFFGGKDNNRPQQHRRPQEHHRPQVFKHEPDHQESFNIPSGQFEGHFIFPDKEFVHVRDEYKERPNVNPRHKDNGYDRERTPVHAEEFVKDHGYQQGPVYDNLDQEPHQGQYENHQQTGYQGQQSGYDEPQPDYTAPRETVHQVQKGYETPQKNSYIVQDGFNGYETPQESAYVVKDGFNSYETPQESAYVVKDGFNSYETPQESAYVVKDGFNSYETPQESAYVVQNGFNGYETPQENDYVVQNGFNGYETPQESAYVVQDESSGYNKYETQEQPYSQVSGNNYGEESYVGDTPPEEILSKDQYEPKNTYNLLDFNDFKRLPQNDELDHYQGAASTQVESKVNSLSKEPYYDDYPYYYYDDESYYYDNANDTYENVTEVPENVTSVQTETSPAENETSTPHPLENSPEDDLTTKDAAEVTHPVESEKTELVRKKREAKKKHYYSYYPLPPVALRNRELKDQDDLLVYQETVIRPSPRRSASKVFSGSSKQQLFQSIETGRLKLETFAHVRLKFDRLKPVRLPNGSKLIRIKNLNLLRSRIRLKADQEVSRSIRFVQEESRISPLENKIKKIKKKSSTTVPEPDDLDWAYVFNNDKLREITNTLKQREDEVLLVNGTPALQEAKANVSKSYNVRMGI